MFQFLRYVNRLRMGHRPIFMEYEYDFKSRWNEGEGNSFIQKIISSYSEVIEENVYSLQEYLPLVATLSDDTSLKPKVDWRNHFIPVLDALSLMWAARRAESKFIEIGSGNSTIFIKRSIEHYGSDAKLISIDPQPREDVNGLCDEVVRKPLEQIDLSIFDQLESGDALFIDNSHRSFMNTDVTVVMLDILPRLRSGVLIGFHDIFLPFDYFESWSNRAYNEQYLLGCYLLSNPNYFSIQFSNYWAWKNGSHVEPLTDIWNLLGHDVRDRRPSAFWGVKN